MRTKFLRGILVVDRSGLTVGTLEDLDLKRDGRYALIVKGEASSDDAKEHKKSFGIAGVGKDFFEIGQEHVASIGAKVTLNKRFDEIGDLKVL